MKLYRTELDSGLNNKQFLVESESLGIKNVKDRIKCVLSCDKTSTGYRIYGNVFCNTKFLCDRCLSENEKHIKTTLTILLTNNKDIVRENSFDVLKFTISDDFVDLSSILHDVIEVEKPIKSLCRDDCKGLCPSCGLDLNLNRCRCKDNSSMNKFKELKSLIK